MSLTATASHVRLVSDGLTLEQRMGGPMSITATSSHMSIVPDAVSSAREDDSMTITASSAHLDQSLQSGDRNFLVGFVVNGECDMPQFNTRKAFCKLCAITGRKLERWQERVLGVPEFIQAIDELASWSYGFTICGNEAQYRNGDRDDFQAITLPLLQHLEMIGKPRAIVTTGFQTARNRGQLRETGTDVTISLDGPKEVNDRANVRGGFDHVMHNLDQSWRDLRDQITIASVVRQDTVDHLAELLPTLERYQITNWTLSTFIDYGAIQVIPKLSDRVIETLYELGRRAKECGINLMFEHLGKQVLAGAPFDVLRVPDGVSMVRLSYDSTLSVGAENHEAVNDDSFRWNPHEGDELLGTIRAARRRRLIDNALIAKRLWAEGRLAVA